MKVAATKMCFTALLAGLYICAPSTSFSEGDSVIDKVGSDGLITLGVRRDAKPHSYLDADGHAAGYTVDVCASVVDRLRAQLGLSQLRMKFETVDATDRFEAVAEHRWQE